MAEHLTPTELARHVGLERRDVIAKCMELGVPIFDGRIDRVLFEGALAGALRTAGAVHFTLFDSGGNMIESFTSSDQALQALRDFDEHDRAHVRLIAFDAEGNVVGPVPPTRVSSRA
jgi:hypothetical protein